MNENNYNFYDMVENWTVNDYCTPGIKAEVILDMLISEFIEDLVQYHYLEIENREYKVTLLAKEFPIWIYEENKRNAKVDYLVSVGNEKLVLVELKSTNESIIRKQEERMKKAVDRGVKELISFYHQIVESKKGNSLDIKKYQYVFKKFNENLIKAQIDIQTVKKNRVFVCFLN